jgi:hypothetical protein
MFKIFATIGSAIKFAWEAATLFQKINMVFQAATLAIGVKGFFQARNLLARGQDILANKTAAGGKIPVIYGRRRVGAQIVYMDTASNRSKDLFIVYALSVGECEQIEGQTIELDGNSITDSSRFRDGWYIGSDKISSGAGSLNTADQVGTNNGNASAGSSGTNPAHRYRAVFNLHHGANSQTADPMLVASVGSQWTSAHKLNGITYIASSYEYDTKAIFKGVPQLTVVVKGQKVYDPRLDSTVTGGSGSQRLATLSTYEWTDNSACCFLSYITNDSYGKGLTSSDLDLESFRVAAVLTDTLVDTPDFNGSYASTTWSASDGSNQVTFTNESQWSKYKLGDTLYLKDSSGSLIVNGKTISDIQRNKFYGQAQQNIIIIDDEFDDDYDDEGGTSLVKSKRFHCNGVIDTNKNVMENAKELLGNMRGILNYVDGKYELLIEDTGSSEFTVTDDHIIDGISIDYGNKDNRANKVVVEFFNGAQGYEQDTVTVYHNNSTSTYKDDDGGEELEVKVAAPHVVSPYVAWNMGKAVLSRSRYQTSINFMATPELYKVNVGSIITVTYAGLGLSGKLFRIETMDLQANGLIAIGAIEYFDIYTWVIPPVESVPPKSDPPTGFELVVPTGLSFNDTSNINPRAFLTWTENTDYPVDLYRATVLDSGSKPVVNKTVNSNYIYLDLLAVGSYTATVTAINSVGAESNPSATYSFSVAEEPIRTGDLQDGAVTDAKVNNLSANKITTGELNLGTASGMAVKQAKSGYTDTTTGFWLGNDGGTPKFNIGTSTNYLKFDGSNLLVAGDISASTGTISTSIAIGSGNNIFKADSNGIYLGNATFGSAPFRVTPAGALTATGVTINGALTLTNVDGTTITYTAGNLGVGIIGGSNLGTSAIFPATLRYERSNATTAPSDAEFNTAFGRNPKTNDVVVVARTDTNVQVAYKHNGSSFAVVSNYIDGDLIVDGSITTDQIAANTIVANNIAAGTITGTNINVDTLAIKFLADVDTQIYDHDGNATKLTLNGFTLLTRSQGGGSTGAGICVTTIDDVRDGARYIATLSGVFGNINGWKVQLSVDGGSSWATAAGGLSSIYWNAGTYRGYTYVYSGTTSQSSGQNDVKWRVYTGSTANYTQVMLNVVVFNTG